MVTHAFQATGDARLAPRHRWRRRLVLLAYFVLLGECGARAYWYFAHGVSALRPREIWRWFYPELAASGLEPAEVRPDDATYDVLLLGGSVLNSRFGDIAQRLQGRLESRLGRPVRVFNLAESARTSRDSLIKYRSLGDCRFDLVVLYHAINDTRMNNCPRRLFRDDYRHCSWYKWIHLYQRHRELPYFVLPYTARFLAIDLVEDLPGGWILTRHRPPRAWLEEGADLKTPAAFEANLRAIAAETAHKGEALLVMTFAWHIPPDYSAAKFRDHQLDYGAHTSAVEIWGRPAHVAAGLEAHNEVVRRVAAEDERLLWVDQQARMPKSGVYFDDCCHLTSAGCERFVEHILEELAPRPPAEIARRPSESPR